MIQRDNQYWSISYDEANQAVICTWKSTSEDMTDDEFKIEMTSYVEVVEKYQVPKLLLNLRNGSYTVAPEVQEWVADEIAPRAIQAGQNKIATILSQNIFSQVSTQQMMEEGDIPLIQQQYFEDVETASQWLFEDN